jgi:V-type H+-transporting ATPase subunit C
MIQDALRNGGRELGKLHLPSKLDEATKKTMEVATVDKTKFKIGTLDQLMELNETLVKVDHTLDATCKKIEKIAKETATNDTFVEVHERGKISPVEYVKSFQWENRKYAQGRSLVEIAGLISDRMKMIDNDIKKIQDELTEARNNHAQLVKKEGNSFLTQDISGAIYSSAKNIDPKKFFVETIGSEMFATVIAVVNKTQIPKFKATYEKVLPWNAEGQFGAIPRSDVSLGIEDAEGNQLWRIVVVKDRLQEYITEGRKQGLILRPFVYDAEGYKKEIQIITELENKANLLKTQLAQKSLYAFSELLIALMHLKVLRAFIDGVLRFGIPPKFFIGVVEANRGSEKGVLAALNEKFDDKTLAGMYGGAGGKDEVDTNDDFFSFVSIPLTTPMGI